MSIETITKSEDPTHFEVSHEGDETIVCVQNNGACSVLAEIDGSPEQQAEFESMAEQAFERLDDYFGGRFAELFEGLHIKLGKNSGGGEAFKDQNLIVFDIDRMAMSLADSEAHLVSIGILEPGDWTSVMSEEQASAPASCLMYNIVHEVGHLLDERNENGEWIGLSTDLSPTKYGANKENEAFAEAFTYEVFGSKIEPDAQSIIRTRIDDKISELSTK